MSTPGSALGPLAGVVLALSARAALGTPADVVLTRSADADAPLPTLRFLSFLYRAGRRFCRF